jgi:hypothetical protein
MPKGSILSCLEKRELLNQPAVSVETLLRWAERFAESEMFHDALDFYEKAGAREPVKRLMAMSVEEGDLFLCRRASKVLKFEPDTTEWLDLARAAKSRSKLLFAAEAFRQAGVNDDASEETLVS